MRDFKTYVIFNADHAFELLGDHPNFEAIRLLFRTPNVPLAVTIADDDYWSVPIDNADQLQLDRRKKK